ncbi:MAG: heavy-metal-associated domain-containing protein [Erysipelotrichaceae bacterium]|jgi:copper chaperone|nr:heavy metal-associated domain-containing protein [Bacilli bacterium]NLV29146.1 heavy-metal-associated domain-containing protein [Erysipelotrichaceae bacterium]HPY79825.1 heavy metal-associated domain-containing protein [Bacilli bacterium]HQA55739.1 heavy metal-associated domain-containing protein [Bacilli bacterium]
MNKIVIKVDGMHCGMCEAHVNDAVRKVKGVNKVNSDRSKGEVVVIAKEDINIKDIKDAITKQGYRVISEYNEPYEKKGFFDFLRKK